MIKYIILRHGQSMANSDGTYTGQTDVELSPTGLLQADVVSDYIIKNFKLDVIYSSDLKRAVRTVKKVSETLNLPINTDKRLRELYGGKWQGMRADEIEKLYPENFKLWRENIGLSHPEGGECMLDVQRRGVEFFKDKEKELDGKTVLISTHACFIRSFQCYVLNVPMEEMQEVKFVNNASISVVNYDSGKFTPEYFNFSEHLACFGENTTIDV